MQRQGSLIQKAERFFQQHMPLHFHRRTDRVEHDWLTEHPRLIAFLLGCLVTLLLLGLLSIIHVQLGREVWPLFG
ncbi:MAG TPA: hypothetical protein VIR77_04585 [Pontiella sp.]